MQLAGLKASKNLGQHFLIDRDSLESIIAAGELRSTDTVLEIGPGLGVMTGPLTRLVKDVVAVEADETLAEILMREKVSNLKVITQDIRHFDLTSLPKGYKVVANIPYYVTSPIFRLLLSSDNRPGMMSLLIQKEVAERITARPGQMSVLALSVQYYGEPTLIQVVERYKFWPAPKVDSAVLQVRVFDTPVFPSSPDKLFRLIKAGFGEKRKMLKNSLAGGLNITMDLAIMLLERANLPLGIRAQELTIKDWEKLYRGCMDHGLLS